MNTDLSISFIKAHHQTIGQLKKRSEEIGNFKKSVEKEGNKLNTQNGYSENISPFNTPSLLPQTLNFTKVKEARDNIQWHNAMKELNIMEVNNG